MEFTRLAGLRHGTGQLVVKEVATDMSGLSNQTTSNDY